jgi:polysaccharide export outer membrane protein
MTDDHPTGIEFIGNLLNLLKSAGLGGPPAQGKSAAPDTVLELFVSSVKEGPGAEPLAFLHLTRRPGHHKRMAARRVTWRKKLPPRLCHARLRHLLPVLFTCALLTGCGILARGGPETSDMMNVAKATQGRITLVELDQATADALATIPEPTLQSVFGDNRPAAEQRIGVGDLLQITLWEAGSGGLFATPAPTTGATGAGSHSISIPDQVVSIDGAITVPFAGRVPVVDRSPPQVEQEIVARLAGKAVDPQALVTVTKNLSSNVTVMGEVGPGARIPLSVRGDRLLDVIAAAGGIKAAVSDITVVLSRGGRSVRTPMQEVLDTPRDNIYMRPDDQVVLVHDPQSLTVAGATGRNALIPFETQRLTLDEALAKAGGLLDDRADPSAVFILRYEPQSVLPLFPKPVAAPPPPEAAFVPVIYHIDMRRPVALFAARHFLMRNKDILYVADARSIDIQKLFGLVGQLVAPAVTGLEINNAVP